MVNVALIGHGVVGSGVAEILINDNALVNEKIKDELYVKYILDLRDFPDLPYSDRFIKDFNRILEDDSVRVVAEMMGGLHPAYEFSKQCLLAGKSVVTSNKELVAAKGAELLEIAREKNVNYLFEASVGGGIPILRPMAQCLAANHIESITGILNGTTNFILNKMIVDNMSFENALKLAQDNGYAEKDPTADIEGHDACRKICILAALGFGKHVYPDQVSTEGISSITLGDVEYADRFNCVIKLIAQACREDDGHISATVRPTLVPREHILSGVHGVFNAIVVNGDKTGDLMFYGKGAGKMATASAVSADILDCAKHLTSRKYLSWTDGSDDYVITPDKACRLYVYAKAEDYDALCKSADSAFGNCTVIKNEYSKEIALITANEPESTLREKCAALCADTVKILHTLY
ncbi:MAG: homoserine dehydrogenase [Clostridia bacterium]|nr:homoserine dehydrogenase [Clostridia bacterium]